MKKVKFILSIASCAAMVAIVFGILLYKNAESSAILYIAKTTEASRGYRDNVKKLSGAFDSDTLFTTTDTTSTEDAIKLHNYSKQIESLQAEKQTVTSTIKTLKRPPLSNISKTYKKAQALQSSLNTYTDTADTVVQEYDTLITFMTQSNDLTRKAETFEKSLASTFSAESDEALLASLDTAIKELKTLADAESKLVPPAYLADAQKSAVALSTKMMGILDTFSSAVKADDMDKLDAVYSELAAFDDNETATQNALIAAHKDSSIRSAIDAHDKLASSIK